MKTEMKNLTRPEFFQKKKKKQYLNKRISNSKTIDLFRAEALNVAHIIA